MTRLRFERISRRISQTQLATEVCLHQTEISQIERGRLLPTPEQLHRLANALRVDPEDLLKDVAVLRSR